MNDNAEQQPLAAATSYPESRLAAAFVTALTHQDAETRHRAEIRGRQWQDVLAAMTSGRVTVGSRTPVAGFPSWVTPEVLRGGFPTGAASAGGPLQEHETAAARDFGVPAERRALFAHCLTEPGLARLWDLLDSGAYEVGVPEEAALLTVAWLVRHGESGAAFALVRELEPFADRLRFLPRPAGRPGPDAGACVHRRTVADTAGTLGRRRPNTAVETQREALAVWQPFGDELLVHWLATARDGRVLALVPDAGWQARSEELLGRYRELAARHTLCGKHRDPKENLGILCGALEEVVARRPLTARRLGLLRHAVRSMVRRRGLPGSDAHLALRRRQATQAALPSHHALAQLMLRRLAALPPETGITDVAPYLCPVTVREGEDTGLPAGAVIPAAIGRAVEAALSAPLATLVERGVVPSAEVMAELVPQLVAAATAHAYDDETLRALMAANYRAFRRRRSLLLLDLAQQVRVEELPWVRAVSGRRSAVPGASDDDGALSVLRQLGELAVQAFPGTLLPNPLVREFGVLGRQCDLGAPFVEELAADIFMGTFGPKFLKAARIAGDLLGGTLYERYYGIDYDAIRNLAIVEASEALARAGGARTSPGFARLCAERAGAATRQWSTAANGVVIEQAQILTTHNLATLVGRVGIAPQPGWADLAHRSFVTVCRLVTRVQGDPWPLRTIKDAAYAWRQMVFHLSLCPEAERRRLVAGLAREAARHPAHAATRLAPALAGLSLVAEGGAFGADGTADGGRARRFTGWTTERHWMR
ncbi:MULTISPECIES: hypothetical protein [unclassified Streptomyces]|uniref:hypothetical protein n=1 Tax=unclassified Streptomyces TaxID=2593676 RepID=UPI000DADC75E|nr:MULTISPECIES: hypothetical protein [unclassified Streptomyces]PZT73418.1 hypothetical protein DNK55_14075 [Streptomyces sp. AC1-42T]PZT83594.1 hypothetical protein DNK56_17350 [Streptomyces sp. AC1-42W]